MIICRLSSVVEHFHGKEGVMSSNLIDGSRIRQLGVFLYFSESKTKSTGEL